MWNNIHRLSEYGTHKFYYLESRYYDPVVGRFLTPDSIDYLGDGEDLNNYNLYAYCSNNPIMYRDPSGHLHVIIGAIAWATVSFGSSILSDILAGESIDWWGALFSAGLGAVSGVLSSATLGPAIQFLGGAILSAAENLIKKGKKDGFENINYIDVSINALLDGVFSIGNGLSKTASKHLKAQYRQMKRRIFKQIKFKGAFEALKKMKPAVTYYLKQTSTLFYKPLMRDIEKEILSFFCEHKTIENT